MLLRMIFYQKISQYQVTSRRRSLYSPVTIFLASISSRQSFEIAMGERSQSFNGSDKHVQVIARPRFVGERILVFSFQCLLPSPLSDQEKCQNSTSCLNVNETRREIVVNCKTSATRFFNYDHVKV